MINGFVYVCSAMCVSGWSEDEGAVQADDAQGR